MGRGMDKDVAGTSLLVQWLRIYLAMQGTQVFSSVREPRSHMPWGMAKKQKKKKLKKEDMIYTYMEYMYPYISIYVNGISLGHKKIEGKRRRG